MPPAGAPGVGSRRLALVAATFAAVAVCLLAATWQWDRAHRTPDEAVPQGAAVALAELDPTTAYSGMRVRLTGQFDPANELLVAPRSRDGVLGSWVLTPLRVDTGDSAAVAVVRGWVPAGTVPALPPEGPVEVEAVLVADSRSPDPEVPSGDPPTVTAIDTGVLAVHAGYPVRSGWFALRTVDPARSGQPAPLQVTELPGADVGLDWQNAAYAIQWVAFAGFAVFFGLRFWRDQIRRSTGSPT